MNNVPNLPKQECWGPWCPVFLNLQQPWDKHFAVDEHGEVISLNPEVFAWIVRVGESAEQNGVRLKQLLLSLAA
ncbi:MAG: hypothetical protein HZB09_00265 [Candidatus Yonathbacteria bacterium]|nr:hypothetical protein [Candidatus Yonathbacteria bacterium]